MSEEANTQEAGQEQSGGLNFGDIQAAVQIIDVCTQRGAIRGDELVQVGTLRERFVGFLRLAQESGEEVGELPPSAYNAPEAPAEEAPAEAAE
ncbi:hypothetical protein N9M52_00065 [bacterium]|nr:hypothetical protein [bacterium]MDA8752379.1 hypothetical protein [bacterium]